jgi:glycosyltransferase involved in cell wall biosynthesis
LLHPHLSYRRWLQLTRSSAVVFNTPGVYGCLGWKLGEYLALGKAIISTPIRLQLPAHLQHGTHVHVVDGSEESMRDAIQRITSDDAYRLRLEFNSRAYFDRYLNPPAAIQRFVSCS